MNPEPRPDRGLPQVTRALAATLFAALLLVPAAGTHGIKEGGTFRIAVAVGSFNAIDPALVGLAGPALDPRCGTLMGYPDKPLPAGFALAPELAEAEPVVSEDGRTYTFTIRKDARFSDGKPVTARAFAHALERIFTPAMDTDAPAIFADIVGAQEDARRQGDDARGRRRQGQDADPAADRGGRLTSSPV